MTRARNPRPAGQDGRRLPGIPDFPRKGDTAGATSANVFPPARPGTPGRAWSSEASGVPAGRGSSPCEERTRRSPGGDPGLLRRVCLLSIHLPQESADGLHVPIGLFLHGHVRTTIEDLELRAGNQALERTHSRRHRNGGSGSPVRATPPSRERRRFRKRSTEHW
jgi:hypothetical protein